MATWSPAATSTAVTVPSAGAVTRCSIFMASSTISTRPASTRWPGSTLTSKTLPGMGAASPPPAAEARPGGSNRDGGVLTVTLADEANRNALSGRLVAELTEALDRADADPEVRVVVLTNRGSVFCAGADLRERSSRPSSGSDRPEESGPSATPSNRSEGPSLSPSSADRQEAPSRSATSPDRLPGSQSQRSFTSPVADLLGRFRRSPKPYVGRIAGHCVAGGMGLAAAMDISIAPHEAKFGFTEVRLGLAPAMISVLCLPKMSPADAASAFLRGNRFPAAEAARMGLITVAVESHRLDAAVDAAVARPCWPGAPRAWPRPRGCWNGSRLWASTRPWSGPGGCRPSCSPARRQPRGWPPSWRSARPAGRPSERSARGGSRLGGLAG